jgi:hypothetical protein
MNGKSYKLHEHTLYEIWKSQNFINPPKTITGEEILILDAGIYNNDTAGPDFKNARIRIGNLTFVGDIEIDCNYSDWKIHGHHIDNKYSKVILHAAFLNKNKHAFVYTRDGRKINSICLSELLEKTFVENLFETKESNEHNDSNNLRCHFSLNKISQEQKEKYLYQLGASRFEKKCKKLFNRIKELQFLEELKIKEPVVSYDLSQKFHNKQFKQNDFVSKLIWQQLLYELIFEALGFTKNKNQMVSLAQYANIKFLMKIENDGVINEKLEAALFNIAGLVHSLDSASDDATKKYIERISLFWNSIRSMYDGKILAETDWHFFRLRPQNFPTIRIAGGVRILHNLIHKNLIGMISKKIIEINNLKSLANTLRSIFIVKADGYWKNHYIFDQTAKSEIKYFVGVSRADEIIVNVILPFFSVYFDLFGNAKISKKILTLYSEYEQRSENQIILDMGKSLELKQELKRTIITQGAIELFRNFCSRNRCLECEIGKIVFN